MGMRNNLAAALRFVMIIKHLTLAELAEKLEISRSALQDYLKVRGNPSIAMVEHLAQKMGIKPSVLLTDKSLEEFFALLLDAFPEVSETDEMRKLRFIELAAEMEQFLSDEP
ncbi:MAG: helix-turn-helix domain-containing protein [Oscillospiraceae bacterium]|jgi:transcriptional regulator with XRE-family HTH domain|nr:helix-turn-helix domain-containing protein [Oscillospiraceae bacterium]